MGQGVERGISYIAEGLNAILRENQTTTVLLETMAGKGSEVGGRFEELREILDRVVLADQMASAWIPAMSRTADMILSTIWTVC